MSYKLEIIHFAVGQGLCVAVTLREDESLIFLGILDMGSLNNLTYSFNATDKLKVLIYENGGILNYVLVSHQDIDHYNLFENLAASYSEQYPDNPKIMIKKLLLGINPIDSQGQPAITIFQNNYIVNNDNFYYVFPDMLIRDEVDPYLCQEWRNIPIDEDIVLNKEYIFQIHCLLAGAVCREDASINTGSIIVLITILRSDASTTTPEYSYLFTGDATAYTLAILNDKEFAFKSGYKSMLIPHHGAYPTMNYNLPELTKFLDSYAPTGAFVSAKASKSFMHPSSEIMDIFINKITRTTTTHKVTAVSYSNYICKIIDNFSGNVYCTFQLPNECNNRPIYKFLDKYKGECITNTYNFDTY